MKMMMPMTALALLASLSLTACGDDDDKTVVVQPPAQSGTTVVPQSPPPAVKVCPQGATVC